MSTSPWPHSCNSTLGRLATMSALRNQTDKRAHILLSHTLTHAHTATYNSFMSIFLAVQYIPAGSSSIRVQKQGRSLPPISLFFLRLLLSHLSPSMSFYLHCRLFSSNSLPDRGRGAALLLRAEHRGLCTADHTQKRWFTRGCFVVVMGPRRHND